MRLKSSHTCGSTNNIVKKCDFQWQSLQNSKKNPNFHIKSQMIIISQNNPNQK